ncbi:MAG: tRNA uridine-5-carboxymethylaminomethyl(34) synthesis GTPase MnmE [Burkholderiaceae bacterium]|jgi:tRNA modification GTPase|nr:tRNA uridine-5-carboxymethylaminomethyl(34) synthesis GTPase MnmE [Burkholderiales bacterium]MCZ8103223.1 tRNA uridine-5-carboxymethylaminomethyl(34) synthesis GTPase MnmE [Burkholderiales bacterium]MCZ8337894.1 tRNA uridine-5-carboxymethylaminomethyl(34) synthesis GTPase MnmE [Burkholderiaceae bacterium]
MIPLDTDPIAAIATAPGRGGIGVVRVSGRDLSAVIDAVCGRPLAPRTATLLPFRAADGGAIDTGLALHFPAPHSYTGEDVLELQGHGGPVVMQLLLERVLEAGRAIGVRVAEPGEFTRRAFLNDKLDLAQAEAVADLIDASTAQAARGASRSLSGAFSKAVHAVVDALIELRMLLEATLDFPEEEIDFLERSDARGRLDAIRAALDALLADARQGALLREGLHVVLAGAPNVGKSSLLNALAGAEVAIVTPVAGTTRDRIAQAIQVDGVPLVVVDTAGLRETGDEVERIGIERTWQEVARADVILHLGVAEAGEGASARVADPAADAAARFRGNVPPDGEGARADLDAGIAARLPRDKPILRVWNKIDLAGLAPRATDDAVWLSAKDGRGIELLRAALLRLAGWHGAGEGTFIARERHLEALRAARGHLAAAHAHAQRRDEVLDLFAEELRLAQERLSSITGEFGADDLLGVIFSMFCIGK